MADQLKGRYRTHLFICQGKSCSQKLDAEKAKQFFKEKIKEHGLKGQVRACTSSCLDLCDNAPNIVVYPEATWYSHVTETDLQKILEKHILEDPSQ